MKRITKKIIEFAFADDGNSLNARLVVNGTCVFDAKLTEVPSMNVSLGKANEDELVDNATYFARRSPTTWQNPAAWLAEYAASRQENIIDCLSEIRKNLRMIERHALNTSVSKNARSRVRK